MDDAQRPGERETVREMVKLLQRAGLAFRINQLRARTTQTVIAGGRLVGAPYYY